MPKICLRTTTRSRRPAFLIATGEPSSRSTSVFPRRAGEGETRMPAASIAAILSSAPPLPPEMIAPAWPMRRPGRGGAAGDEADHRLLAAALRLVLDELRRVLLGRAADLADHHDRLGLVVGQEHFEHVDELGALDRVAADADRGGLAEALARGLEHRLIGQRARARDDADRARLEDIGRHDADLALAGGDDAGAVRPDQPRLRARRASA